MSLKTLESLVRNSIDSTQQELSSFGTKVQMQSVMTHHIRLYIPTKVDVNLTSDTSAYVERAKKLMIDCFGGVTYQVVPSFYESKNIGLVRENVFIVESWMTRQALSEHLSAIFDFISCLHTELREETLAIEIDGKKIVLSLLETDRLEPVRLDAFRLAEYLGFSTEEIAQILKIAFEDIVKHPDSEKFQEDLLKLESLIGRLRVQLGGSMDYVHSWLRSPHPVLGGRTAISYLLEGKFEIIEGIVYAIEVGQPL